jgi:hypothetical protein
MDISLRCLASSPGPSQLEMRLYRRTKERRDDGDDQDCQSDRSHDWVIQRPAPFRPSSAHTLPAGTSRLTSTSAWVWPNERASRSMVIAAEVMAVEFRSSTNLPVGRTPAEMVRVPAATGHVALG